MNGIYEMLSPGIYSTFVLAPDLFLDQQYK